MLGIILGAGEVETAREGAEAGLLVAEEAWARKNDMATVDTKAVAES